MAFILAVRGRRGICLLVHFSSLVQRQSRRGRPWLTNFLWYAGWSFRLHIQLLPCKLKWAASVGGLAVLVFRRSFDLSHKLAQPDRKFKRAVCFA